MSKSDPTRKFTWNHLDIPNRDLYPWVREWIKEREELFIEHGHESPVPSLQRWKEKNILLYNFKKISISTNLSLSPLPLPFAPILWAPWIVNQLLPVEYLVLFPKWGSCPYPYLLLLSKLQVFDANSAQTDFLSSCSPLSPWTKSLSIMQILRLILDLLLGDSLRMPLFDVP